ncbi:MAG TPA: hypothetical protein VFM53_12780 [Anaeromyxobacteraceae bacterium]|nr:hypothetical protein [Anaeromyxobacteraceae bacterium]
MTTTRRNPVLAAAARALALAALLAGFPARADLVSPGELSRAHEKLDGIQNCTKCHAAGQQFSEEKCLECHKELRPSISAGKGFHGRLSDRRCENCHHEHHGKGFPLVDWGDAGQKGFDHGKTGWPLAGKHAKAKCEACHDPRRVTDGAVKEVLGKGRKSLLGAPTTCAGCHFDEHRGQLGNDCQKCHDPAAWKPVGKGFDHAKTRYPLTGLHVKVPCAKCHVPQTDPDGKHDFPQAVSPTFAKYKPLPFALCTDCHKDPHQNRFGALCATCHVVEGWKVMKVAGGEKTAFHDKTRYPLRGAHAKVECKACHGPFEGQAKAVYKDLKFAACSDCHQDAHLGKLARKGPGGVVQPAPGCDRCHAVEGWVPVRFELADHQKTGYPLEGAHQAVSCERCHVRDPKMAEKAPAAMRAEMKRQHRPVKVSDFTMERKVEARKCTACHRDVHQGQFEKRMAVDGCAACHDQVTFSKTRFDHARDTKFRLDGKHGRTACASCHATATGKDGKPFVRYAGAPVACAKCHADPHAAQFAVKKVTECAGCHGVEDWKKLKFVHGEPFTTYTLAGKHAKVACDKCHPAAQVGEAKIKRFKPVPRDCQACHADFHKGAFRGYEP